MGSNPIDLLHIRESTSSGFGTRGSAASLIRPSYQRFLLQSCHRFDRPFSLQRRTSRSLRLLIFHTNRKTTAGVPSGGPCVVLLASTLHIRRYPGVQRAVRTSQDIYKPGIGLHHFVFLLSLWQSIPDTESNSMSRVMTPSGTTVLFGTNVPSSNLPQTRPGPRLRARKSCHPVRASSAGFA